MFDRHKSLLRRVAKLERLMYEKTVGRGGGDSRAYTIWKLLRDEGPMTRPDIRNRLGYTTPIVEMEAENCVTRSGNTYSANLDYNWEDVGPIPRTAQQEMINAIRSGSAQSDADIQREPPTRSARAPRQRTVKQNLFSRKFDEVKAAVDAGQDVNQVNAKGQTPLLFAANSKTGNNADIIEYLLTHGAHLNPRFKDLNAFDLVCKNSNIDAMKAILANDVHNVIVNPSRRIKLYYKDVPDNKDLILLAASKEKYKFNSDLHEFYNIAYRHKTISKEQYEQIIETTLDNCVYDGCSTWVISNELKNEIISTIRKIADKTGTLVNISYVVLYHIDWIPDSVIRQLLSMCKEVASGKLSMKGSVADFVHMCKQFCDQVNDESFMGNLLNPKFISNIDDYELSVFFNYAVSRDVHALSKLVAAKVKLSADKVCGNRNLQDTINNEITRLAVRLIDKNTSLNKRVIIDVAGCKNAYLIDYVIGMGYGEELLARCVDDRVPFRGDHSVAIKVLRENGFNVPSDAESRENLVSAANIKNNVRDMVSCVIDAIKDDTWSRNLERYVTDHPEILLDNSVAKAIEDNNTLTSRQLRRRIERLPKDQDVYDL